MDFEQNPEVKRSLCRLESVAGKGVSVYKGDIRNARQELRRYHNAENSVRAERGSNWLQAQLAAAAIGCKLSLLRQQLAADTVSARKDRFAPVLYAILQGVGKQRK